MPWVILTAKKYISFVVLIKMCLVAITVLLSIYAKSKCRLFTDSLLPCCLHYVLWVLIYSKPSFFEVSLEIFKGILLIRSISVFFPFSIKLHHCLYVQSIRYSTSFSRTILLLSTVSPSFLNTVSTIRWHIGRPPLHSSLVIFVRNENFLLFIFCLTFLRLISFFHCVSKFRYRNSRPLVKQFLCI